MHMTDFMEGKFWSRIIDELHERHFILKSQKLNPERWGLFYNLAAPIMEALLGDASRIAVSIVDCIEQEGLVSPGLSVIDLGCGTGWLTLELARRDYRVTAVDASTEMINFLKKRAPQDLPICTVCSDFYDFRPTEPQDLCIAVNFPPLFSTKAISHLVDYAYTKCCITLVNEDLNKELEFRQKVFIDLLKVRPMKASRLLLTWLFGYLLSRNVVPNVKTIEVDSKVCIRKEDLLEFYRLYFTIFGIESTIVENLFLSFFGASDQGGSCVEWERRMKFCMVWWSGDGS